MVNGVNLLSMNMDITLDNNLDESLPMQLASAIKEQILSGELKPNEPLPSIQTLARALHISENTTKKAYQQLERQEFIYTQDEAVSFVKDHSQATYKHDEFAMISTALKQIASTAKSYNIPIEDVHKKLDAYYTDI